MADVEKRKCAELRDSAATTTTPSSTPASPFPSPPPPAYYYQHPSSSLADGAFLAAKKEKESSASYCCCPRGHHHHHNLSATSMSFFSVSEGGDPEGTTTPTAHTCCSHAAAAAAQHPRMIHIPETTTAVSSPPSTDQAKGSAGLLSIFGAFIALFCTFGLMNSFGTFHAYYSSHQLQHLSPSKISWIGSMQLCIFFFSGGFIGRVFDSYGPTGLMLAGSVCYALSIVATAFSTHYTHYMVSQGLFFGLSVGLLFYPSLASVSTHFRKYRATALGIVAAGSSVGGVVYPIILQRLFESHGFRLGVLICGLSSALACGVSSLTVSVSRKAPPPGTHVCALKAKPGTKRSQFFDFKSITDTRFALLVAGSCFVALGLFTPFFYIVEYAHHLPPKTPTSQPFNAYYVLAVLNAGGVLGRVAPAYLSDTLGHFNLLFPAALLSGVSCVSLWLPARTVEVLLAFAAVYGFFSGAFVSLITPCVVQVSESREIGTRIGMLYTIISVPSLIGGPIAGALLTHDHGSYTGTILFSGVTVMLGSVFIFGCKLAIDRRILARV